MRYDVTIPYSPRPLQRQLHSSLKRFNVLVCHRRFGKTVFAINHGIKAALTCPQPDPRFAYVAPTYKQAKLIAWDYVKRYAGVIPGVSFNEQELRCDFPNKARFRLFGADNPDSLRGIYLDGVIPDEPALMPPTLWPQVIRPLLEDRKGWALFIGTPKGHNQFYELHQKAMDTPDWFTAVYRASETGIFTQEQLADLRRDMSEEEYQQEFECFPPGTMIATSRGYLPIEAVRVGDTVLTHRGRWRPVIRTMCKEFSGELVAVKAFGSTRPLRSTPEHPYRLYDKNSTSYRWAEASELKPADCTVLPCFTPVKPVISEPMAGVIAWYITEGSVSGNSVTFSLNPHRPEEADRVRGYLEASGYQGKQYAPGSLTVSSVALADQLTAWCGCLAENKRIPFDMIGGHEEFVFNELMLGDGCVSAPTQGGHAWMYTTISKGLAYDIQLLAGAIGRRAGITYRRAGEMVSPNNGKTYPASASYCVRVPHGKKMNHSREREAFPVKLGTAYRVREVTRERYEGPVYNLSVKEDESYVANGRAVHNCSFEAAIVGAYFGREMAQAEKDGRITDVPYDPAMPVETWWDLGMDDSTVVWFVQRAPQSVRVIDCLEGSGVGLDWYIRQMQTKPYVYGRHVAPHDIEVRELGTGKSRKEVAASLGVKFDTAPNLPVQDGIEAVRRLISRCWFNRAMGKPVEAMKQYRRDWNEKMGVFRPNPLHDWTSHFADAFRMGAVTDPPTGTTVNYKSLYR